MRNDDAPVGYLLSRREAVMLLGATGLGLVVPGVLPRARFRGPCVARPQQTEGPYFVDEKLHRVDIRPDPTNGAVSTGIPLDLSFNVSRLAGAACAPFAGVVVDVWQCDAQGVYSDVQDPGFNTVGQKFLRGYQVTDANGLANFTTIYPGWYQGRAIHIHFKLRSAPTATPGFEFTSQVYFDDATNDQVLARQPYAAKAGVERRTRNTQDGIFRRSGGEQLLLTPTPQGDGYKAEFAIALSQREQG
jgi:protocatechuate 3,4-dioxygenase beta subunit